MVIVVGLRHCPVPPAAERSLRLHKLPCDFCLARPGCLCILPGTQLRGRFGLWFVPAGDGMRPCGEPKATDYFRHNSLRLGGISASWKSLEDHRVPRPESRWGGGCLGGRGPARGGECARRASLHGRLLLILPAPQPQGGSRSSNPGHEPGRRASLQTSVKERKGSRCEARGSCPSRRARDSAWQAVAGCGGGRVQAEGRQGEGRLLLLSRPGGSGTPGEPFT